MKQILFISSSVGQDILTIFFIANTVDKIIHMMKEWKAIIFVMCKT